MPSASGGWGRSSSPARAAIRLTVPGFFTMVLGVAPRARARGRVWTVQPGGPSGDPVLGHYLAPCRGRGGSVRTKRGNPLAMSQCVLFTAGRAA